MMQNDAIGKKVTTLQESAIDLLVIGKPDTLVAKELGLNRSTLYRWQHYHPAFQAELNRRRIELYGSAVERVRGMLPKALEALESELASDKRRLEAIRCVMKYAGVKEPPPPSGPTETDQIYDELVYAKRREMHAERTRNLSPAERAQLDKRRDPETDACELQAAREAVIKDLHALLDVDESPTLTADTEVSDAPRGLLGEPQGETASQPWRESDALKQIVRRTAGEH